MEIAKNAKVIDIHAHAVLLETIGAAGELGPFISEVGEKPPWFKIGDYCLQGVNYHNSPFTDVFLRLEMMDSVGIDYQVIGPNPLTYLYQADRHTGMSFCRTHNDALSNQLKLGKGRLGGFAALPMQNIEDAIEELDRAVSELGLLGAGIGTNLPFSLDSSEMDNFYDKLVALNAPVYIHPTTPSTLGKVTDKRMERFDLDIMLGFTAEETLATIELIFGGVLNRHPELDICVSHGGGAISFIAGRLKLAAQSRPWTPEHLKADGAFESQFSRLWFDVHVHNSDSFNLLRKWANKDHLLFGTNFSGWDHQSDNLNEVLSTDIDFADNARKFLRFT